MPVSISASTVADGRIPNGGICGDPIRSPGKNTNPDSNNATSRNPRETLRCKVSSSPGRIVVRSQPNSAEIGLASFTIDCVADRKSTRLNSSHVAISYAVFCLKKKNRDYALDSCQYSEGVKEK